MILYSCNSTNSNNSNEKESIAKSGNKFIGTWKETQLGTSCCTITQNGDIYLLSLNDCNGVAMEGLSELKFAFKLVDGQLKSSDGDISYGETNNHIYFGALEYEKIK
jgi:hypothetical protein